VSLSLVFLFEAKKPKEKNEKQQEESKLCLRHLNGYRNKEQPPTARELSRLKFSNFIYFLMYKSQDLIDLLIRSDKKPKENDERQQEG